MTKDEMIARAREVFDIELEGLKRTRDSIGESFTNAVELMLGCIRAEGIIVVTGVGKNLAIAEKMSAIFASTGTRSICLNPVQAMHGDLGMVAPRDILIALSFSGESDEVLRLIPAIRRHGLRVISLTGRPESSLAAMSDVHIEIPCGKEACPFGMAPTNSTTATMAMGDALAMVMLDALKFDISSYAMNHPAGAIGRSLILKVSDIMRTGDRVAAVAPETSVMNALLAMTKAKTGCAVIIDADRRLLGIFTDGDFRRMMASSDTGADVAAVLASGVGDHMTLSPQFIRPDVLAAELLKVFERRRIDDLPVCDASGRLVGLVDINDLPKMKVL